MPKYQEYLQKSWNGALSNPVLFVPKVLSLIVSAAIVLILLISSGLVYFIYGIEKGAFGGFNFLHVLLLTIYILLEVSTLIFFSGMSYGMYKDIIKKDKTGLRDGFKYGRDYFWEVAQISFLYYILIGLPIIGLYYLFTHRLFSSTYANAAYIVVIGVIVGYYAFLVMLRFFVYPSLVLEKGSAMRAIKLGAHYGKIHFKHTLITWLIILGIVLYLRW